MPCNSNFERGDFIADLPDETIDGVTYTAKKYAVDCWELLKGNPTTFDEYPSGSLYIRRLFDQYDQEQSRFLNVGWPTTSPEAMVVKSDGIQVQSGDSFKFSWDIAFDGNTSLGTGNIIVASILLEGNDGTYWFLDDPSGTASNTLSFPLDPDLTMQWYQSDANWSTNYKLLSINVDTNTIDNRQFRSISIDKVQKMPVDGKLYIIFHWGNDVTFAGVTLLISNINFTYRGLINGTYDAYNGMENKVEQAGDYKASRDKEVYLSDGPKLAFKGCLQKRVSDYSIMGGATATITFATGNYFQLPGYWTWLFPKGLPLLISGTTYNNTNDTYVTDVAYSIVGNVTTVTLSTNTISEVDSSYSISTIRFGFTEGFYNAAVFPSGPPDSSYVKPFGQMQTEAVWNQFNRVFSIFEGTIDGLDTYVLDSLDRYDLPDLMHSFFLEDAHPATTNKKFKLLHFDQDPDLCEWNGVFIEVLDYTIPKVYTGHSFKYLEQ